MKKSVFFLVLLLAVSAVYAQGNQAGRGQSRGYNLAAISIGLLALYLITYGLTKTKHLSLAGQRRIWNTFLAVSFFVAGLTGLLIAIRLDLGWNVSLIPDNSYWHIEFGIAMILVAFFHALWHWRYYLAFLKKK